MLVLFTIVQSSQADVNIQLPPKRCVVVTARLTELQQRYYDELQAKTLLQSLKGGNHEGALNATDAITGSKDGIAAMPKKRRASQRNGAVLEIFSAT